MTPPAEQPPERQSREDNAREREAFAVVVNGQSRQVPTGTTVRMLIIDLGLDDRPVAVERNRQVIPRAEHASTLLAPGDHLEVVTFVGGG
jgi:sulfur carrier protein